MNTTSIIAYLVAAWVAYNTFAVAPHSRNRSTSTRLMESASHLMPKLRNADNQTATELARELRRYERAMQRVRETQRIPNRFAVAQARLDRAYDTQMRVMSLADQAIVALSKQGPKHWDNARRFRRELAIAFEKDEREMHDTYLACARMESRSTAEGRRFDPMFDGNAIASHAFISR